MSNFKNLKIRLQGFSGWERIIEALKKQGYKSVYGADLRCDDFEESYGIATYSDGTTCKIFDQWYFDRHVYEIGYLTMDQEIVPASYYTQPKTAMVKEGESIIPTKSNAELLKDMQARFDSTTPPIGLKPRRVHDQARLVEIAEAIVRYAQAGKKVDSQWIAELSYLNEIVGE